MILALYLKPFFNIVCATKWGVDFFISLFFFLMIWCFVSNMARPDSVFMIDVNVNVLWIDNLLLYFISMKTASVQGGKMLYAGPIQQSGFGKPANYSCSCVS